MAKASFLVVGLNPVIQHSLVFDHLVRGQVNRSSRHRVDASGKGLNVVRVLTQSGRPASLVTQLGGPTRDWYLQLCGQDGLRPHWVESGSPIRTCTTVIDLGGGDTTELVEEALAVAEGTSALILEAFLQEMAGCDTLVISGTKAKGLSEELIPSMVKTAVLAGKLVILDVKGQDLEASLPHHPTVIKPNLEELLQTRAPALADSYRRIGTAAFEGGPEQLRAFVESAARDYWKAWGSSLVVTRGAEPTLFWNGKELAERAVEKTEVLNPIGSGDSFTAGLAAVLAQGGSMENAVAEGQRLGALNAQVLKPGSIL